jgi:hypothetical protein
MGLYRVWNIKPAERCDGIGGDALWAFNLLKPDIRALSSPAELKPGMLAGPDIPAKAAGNR